MALKSLLESVCGDTAPDEYRRMFESQYSDSNFRNNYSKERYGDTQSKGVRPYW